MFEAPVMPMTAISEAALAFKTERSFGTASVLPWACFLLLILHICYGVAPNLGNEPQRSLFFLGSSAAFFAVLLVLFLFCVFKHDPMNGFFGVSDRGLQLLCIGSAVAVVCSSLFFSFPNAVAIPAIFAFAVLSRLLWWRGGMVYLVYGAVAATVLLLAVKALDPELPSTAAADMLPVIKWADLEFLAGRNPYFEDYTAVTDGPFYYLPVQWLLYLPFVGLGLDQRLLNLFSMFGCLALFTLVLRGNPHRLACLAGLACLCASRPAVEMIAKGQVWPLWLIVCCYAAAFAADRNVLAAVLLGVMLATNQTFVLLFALVGVYELRNAGLHRALLLGLISLGVYGIIVLPFAHGPIDFLLQYYIELPRLAGVSSERLHNSVLQLSLVGIVTALGIGDLRQVLQVLCGVIGLAAIGFHRTLRRPHFLALAGMIYIIVVALNVQVWKYYYIPGFWLILWSVAGRMSGSAFAESDSATVR
jgi:hypothetical protein